MHTINYTVRNRMRRVGLYSCLYSNNLTTNIYAYAYNCLPEFSKVFCHLKIVYVAHHVLIVIYRDTIS